MRPAKFPIDVADHPLGSIDLGRDELCARFGNGEVPAVEAFTWPGPVHVWGIDCDDGQLVVLVHALGTRLTHVMANPKDLDRALVALGIRYERLTWRRERATYR